MHHINYVCTSINITGYKDTVKHCNMELSRDDYSTHSMGDQVFILLSVFTPFLACLSPFRGSPFRRSFAGFLLSKRTSESDSVSDSITLPNGAAKQ